MWFNGAGGSSDQSPQGYMGQVWWSHVAVKDLVANGDGTYTLTATVSPTADWSDWMLRARRSSGR